MRLFGRSASTRQPQQEFALQTVGDHVTVTEVRNVESAVGELVSVFERRSKIRKQKEPFFILLMMEQLEPAQRFELNQGLIEQLSAHQTVRLCVIPNSTVCSASNIQYSAERIDPATV